MRSDFQFVDYEEAKVAGNGRFNGDVVFAFLLDGYMYITSKNASLFFKAISRINIMGVFENPVEASVFKNCDGSVCYDENTDYPLAKWMTNSIETIIFEKYVKLDAVAPTDNNLNNKQELTN